VTTLDPEAPLPGAPDPWAASQMPPLREGPPYLMTEMIAAEPALAERIVRRLSTAPGESAIGELAGAITDTVRRGWPVVTTGCGTSEHAAMATAALLADALQPGERPLVRAAQALDLVRDPPLDGVLLAISHEGGTWGTNEALRHAPHDRVTTAMVTVGDRSPGARLADVVIETGEQDRSWCHTVGYLSPVVAATVIHGRLRGTAPDPVAVRALLDATSDHESAAEHLAATLAGMDQLLVVATGRDWPAARELALKVEEGAGLPAHALQLETVRHGHLAACDERTGLVLLLTDAEPPGDPVRGRARAVLRSAAALGMPAGAILAPRVGTAVPADLTPAGRLDAPETRRLPPLAEAILSTAIPLQLLAERLARALGRNPDPIGRSDPRQASAADA
jgi:glutamine---fructose-6-phosphate transaminase (isomerizing)